MPENTRDINKNEIDTAYNEGYKMSMAEFKGETLANFKYINKMVEDLQIGQVNLQNQLNNQKLLAAAIGGVSGIITAILSPFKRL